MLFSKVFDDLGTNGAIYRADVARSGVFEKTGVVESANVKWKFKTGGVVLSSPWIGDCVVYVASHDGFIYAIN